MAWHDLYAVAWLATWANNAAWLESLIITGLVVWLGRHKIGRHVAAWWDRHHGHLAEQRHLNALRARDAERRETRLRNMARLREQQANKGAGSDDNGPDHVL